MTGLFIEQIFIEHHYGPSTEQGTGTQREQPRFLPACGSHRGGGRVRRRLELCGSQSALTVVYLERLLCLAH